VARTVVLHPGALGDVLLAVPALRALRRGPPAAELVLAAQPRVGALLGSLGVVDGDVAFDTLGLETLFTDDEAPERLRRLVADAHVVSWFGAGDATFARRMRALAPTAVLASSVPPPDTPVWRHLVASAGPLRAGEVACEPIALPPTLAAEGRRALSAAGWQGERRLVMLHPGAGGLAKRWPADRFATVAERLVRSHGVDVIVHAGPADGDAVAALRAALRPPARVLAEPPLTALAGALGHVALWIGNDSGVTHLAASLGVPTVALFIPPNLRWTPWARQARPLLVGSAAPDAEIDAVVDVAATLLP
jgi:ADP-heptose:LPS heptosyltransferase